MSISLSPVSLKSVSTQRRRPLFAFGNQRGQGLIEYLIVVALIAVATIGVVRVVGQAVATRFASVSQALQGKNKRYAVDAIDENLLKRRDMGTFMNGVGKGDQRGDQ